MNIETKAARIRNGENGQSGSVSSRRDEVSGRPTQVSRLRSLLRGDTAPSRAGGSEDATTDYFASRKVASHSTFPAPSGAATNDTSAGRTASTEDAGAALDALTVPMLQKIIDKRNHGRDADDQVSRSGRKSELIDRILADTHLATV